MILKSLAYALISSSLLGTGYLYLASGAGELTLDNAFVGGRILKVNAPAEGTVEEILIRRGDFVAEGELLFVIGSVESRAAQDKAIEELKMAVDAEVERCIEYGARALALDTEVENQSYQENRLERLRAMNRINALSEDELDGQRSALLKTDLRIQLARQRLDTSAFENSTPILERATVRHALARAKEGFYRVKNTRVLAPAAGYVYELIAYAGEFVDPGEHLLVLVPNEDLFIEANVLESRIDRLRVNMPVRVIPELSDELVLAGRIHSIVPSIAASFSTLPRNNIDSNWIKTSQRVPVLIALESQLPATIPIGSSVKVAVDLTRTVTPAPGPRPARLQTTDPSHWEAEFQALVDDLLNRRRAGVPAQALQSCKWS